MVGVRVSDREANEFQKVPRRELWVGLSFQTRVSATVDIKDQ